MRIVYRAESIIDAHLVKGALEQVGIPAFVSGEYLTGGVGQLPARDLIAVMVPDSLIDAAMPRVRELERDLLANARDDADTDEALPDGNPQPA